MEYNKNVFQKTSDKKVLHKVRKQWVVVSTALLMAIGGGAVATHVSANADTNANNPSSTDTLKGRINQQLHKQTPTITQTQQNSNRSSSIVQQAAVLHNRILNNAANTQKLNGVNHNQDASAGQKQNPVSAPQAVHQNNNQKYEVANDNLDLQNGPSNSKNSNSNSNRTSDSDHLYNVVNNNHLHYDGNGTFYSDYSDNKASDQDGYDYGEIVVRYIDPSDKDQYGKDRQIGSLNILGPVKCSDSDSDKKLDTSFGSNVKAFENNIPQMITTGTDGRLHGLYGFHPVGFDSGQNITNYIAGRKQFLTINVAANKTPIQSGKILVQYLDESNGNKIVQHSVQSDDNSASFRNVNVDSVDVDPFKSFLANVPNGYTADKYSVGYNNNGKINYSSSDSVANAGAKNAPKISSFNGDQAQVLDIYMTPSASEVPATIQYRDVGNNNTVVSTRTVQGLLKNSLSSKLPDMTNFLPAGYEYAGSNNLSQVEFYYNGQTVNISNNNPSDAYVDIKKSGVPVPNPKPVHYSGTVNVNYLDASDGNKLVNSMTFHGPVSQQFNASDAKNLVPNGYVSDTSLNNKEKLVDYSQSPSSYDVYVTKDPHYKPGEIIESHIQYEDVDPNSPLNTPSPINGSTFTLYGQAGTPINYAPYTQNVPSGYVFYKLGAHSNVMGNNQTNYILVEKAGDIAKPLRINYINQHGDNVDGYSTPVSSSNDTMPSGANWKGTPIDEIPIQGTYGQIFRTIGNNASDISKIRPLPNGYSFNLSNNPQYIIGSDSDTVNIPVKGQYFQNYGKLIIHRNYKDNLSSKNNIYSDNVVVPIDNVSTGDILNINPSDYLPNPQSDYSNGSKTVQVKIGSNGTLETTSDQSLTADAADNGTNFYDLNGKSILSPDSSNRYKNTIEFNYKEDDATANVTYVDAYPIDKANNAVVGNNVVTGAPNTPMSDFYGTAAKASDNVNHLATNLPYGYELDTSNDNNNQSKGNNQSLNNGQGYSTRNAGDLVNGATYVIYVKNAHLEPKPVPQKRTGYGFVTINYGSDLSDRNPNSKPKIYSSVVSTGKDGSDFISGGSDQFLKSTESGGKMPNIYVSSDTTNPKLNPQIVKNTTKNNKYSDTPGELDVDVHLNPSNIGREAKDKINYKVIKSDGSSDKDPIESIQIQGKAGSTINYVPYDNNVPSGYYYDGTATYNSIYTKGQTKGQNNTAPVVATIYLRKASYETHNRYPNYNPSDTPYDLPTNKNNNKRNQWNDGEVNSKTGDYEPWNLNGTAGGNKASALLYPSQSNHYFDPLNSSDKIPEYGWSNDSNDYSGMSDQGVDKGFVPQGYVPAWVPNKGKASDYQAGYVPSDNIPSDYIPGYVPSGMLSSNNQMDYVPGYVPANSDLWPGGKNSSRQITCNSDSSKSNNKTINIPKYVPGRVENGHFDSNGHSYHVPGVVPNDPRFAKDMKAQPITINYVNPQYVNSQNDFRTISTVKVNGFTGNYLYLNTNGANSNSDSTDNQSSNTITSDVSDGSAYLRNLPSGYTFDHVLGIKLGTKNKDGSPRYQLSKGSDGGPIKLKKSLQKSVNKVSNGKVTPTTVTKTTDDGYYEFTNSPMTIDVALHQDATGTVVYRDVDKPSDPQVGTAVINGSVGDVLNFNSDGNAYKYRQLLPYNFINYKHAYPATTLQNGGVYNIYVSKSHNRVAPSPRPQKDYGAITINYVSDNQTHVISTNQLIGKDGNFLKNANLYSEYDSDGGLVPYGYDISKAEQDSLRNLNSLSFSDTPQTITIPLSRDPKTYGQPKIEYDKVDYVVVEHTSKGIEEHVLDHSSNGRLVPSDSSDANKNDPLTFTVRGQAGNVIDYSPYQNNVPSGYYYDGMGTHSSIYDAGHNGVIRNGNLVDSMSDSHAHNGLVNGSISNGRYDSIFIRKAKQHIGLGYIQIRYYDDSRDKNDPKNGQRLDTVLLPGRGNKTFDLGYYENNLPYLSNSQSYVFNDVHDVRGSIDSYDPSTTPSTPSIVEIGVKPMATPMPRYGTITIHFVANDSISSYGGSNRVKLPGTNEYATELSNLGVNDSQPEVLSGRDGDIFSPEVYEYNTPANTEYKKIYNGDVSTFEAGNTPGQHENQDVYIAVDSTKGKF